MPRGIREIREKIRAREYVLTKHAREEMLDDGFDVRDVERSILDGDVVREEHDDPRGTKYVVAGAAMEGTAQVATVGRFTELGSYLVITVYRLD